MAKEQLLVPLRIAIGRGVRTNNGKPEVVLTYPDFDAAIDPAIREGMPWTNYQDQFGGMHYDHVAPMGVADDYNPEHQTWLAVITMPPAFAEAAVNAFPGMVKVLTEEEFAEFYEKRAHANEPKRIINAEQLNALRALYGQPSGPLVPDASWDPDDVKAIDPNDPTPGIVWNRRRTARDWLGGRRCKLCKATIAKHRGGTATE